MTNCNHPKFKRIIGGYVCRACHKHFIKIADEPLIFMEKRTFALHSWRREWLMTLASVLNAWKWLCSLNIRLVDSAIDALKGMA